MLPILCSISIAVILDFLKYDISIIHWALIVCNQRAFSPLAVISALNFIAVLYGVFCSTDPQDVSNPHTRKLSQPEY